MQRTENINNLNGVTPQFRQRKISSSRRFHESRKIEPTDMARPISKNMNGHTKYDMINGQPKKASATSLDPFFGAATLLGSVGSLRAAETTDRYRRGSTSHEEDMYRDFPFRFENLVFEGGGNKGMAYVGALQVSVECVLLFWFVFKFLDCYDTFCIQPRFLRYGLFTRHHKDSFTSSLFYVKENASLRYRSKHIWILSSLSHSLQCQQQLWQSRLICRIRNEVRINSSKKKLSPLWNKVK